MGWSEKKAKWYVKEVSADAWTQDFEDRGMKCVFQETDYFGLGLDAWAVFRPGDEASIIVCRRSNQDCTELSMFVGPTRRALNEFEDLLRELDYQRKVPVRNSKRIQS